MADYLSVVFLEKIDALPWYVGVPGMLVIAALVLSAALNVLMLRPVRAIVRLILAFAVVVILSQGGESLARLLGGELSSG